MIYTIKTLTKLLFINLRYMVNEQNKQKLERNIQNIF